MIKQSIAIALTGVLVLNARSVTANPLALPAAGLCSTGVGCILVGTAIIGGVVYYVYMHQGKKVYVPKHAIRPMLDDPEHKHNASGRPGDSGIWEDYVYAPNKSTAIQKCKVLAKQYGVKNVGEPRYDSRKGQFICKFEGRQHE